MTIEFYDFNDFIDYITQIFNKNITNNNIEQENSINLKFKFFCIINRAYCNKTKQSEHFIM